MSTDQNPNQTQGTGTHIPNLWWLITASWLYPSTPPQPHPNTVVSLIIYIYIRIYSDSCVLSPLYINQPTVTLSMFHRWITIYHRFFCLLKSMVNVVNPKQYTICSKSPSMGRTNHPQMVGLSSHFPHYIIISTKNCVNATLMHQNTSYKPAITPFMEW